MAAASRALADGRRPEVVHVAPVPGLPAGMNEVLQIRTLHGLEAAVREAQQRLRLLSAEDRLPLLRQLLELLLEVGRDDDALQHADELQAAMPADGMVSYLRGIALRRKGARDDSHAIFKEAIVLAPFEARAWSAFGAGWTERNDFDRGTRFLRISLFIDGTNANTWGDLGQAEVMLEHYAAARDAFTRAIELGAATFVNFLNRGSCYVALDDATSAVADWARALEIDPTHRRATEIRNKIVKLGISTENDYSFGDLDSSER